jgi:hypothetical protein
MPPDKIDSLPDDVKPPVLELLEQNGALTARVAELVVQNKALLAGCGLKQEGLVSSEVGEA